MMKKINGKVIFIVIWLLIVVILLYSRSINLGWGLPYAMHPDERNMATAIQQLKCELPASNLYILDKVRIFMANFRNCLNPNFFAYGQFPLYFGYFLIYFLKTFGGNANISISFEEATISLRILSAVASILNIFVLTKLVNLLLKKTSVIPVVLIMIFSPFFIQFSHFGTTESLLMLFYSSIIYFSIRLLNYSTDYYEVVILGLISGLAIATKVSSMIFLLLPVTVLMSKLKSNSKLRILNLILCFTLSTMVFTLVFSPHNLINFRDFISSITYESSVGLGKALVFYTRQFSYSVPVLFQLIRVFPYTLGWPTFILGILGMLLLKRNDKKINVLRFAFLVYFIPNAFLYTKWTRFITPALPILLILAIIFLESLASKFKKLNFIKPLLVLIMIIPGIAYLHIYQNTDIRFQASNWIYKNIPENSSILSETANVVDIPITNGIMKLSKNYNTISFNFYDLDENLELQSELKNYLREVDYIFLPSRRIFMNHTCFINDKVKSNIKSELNDRCQILKNQYPNINKYYDDLFSGKLGFKKVAEFNSYPKICLPFSDKCLTFPDEQAEETWTVFDHPVIRIYQRAPTNKKF